MEFQWLSHLIHQLAPVVPSLGHTDNVWAGLCAVCAWLTGHGLGWFGLGAGAAGAAAGAAGGGQAPKPRKVLPLPGGGWLGTDGRMHWSKDIPVGIGPVSGKYSVDVGAAPGSDPRGPLVDANYKVDVKVGPVKVTSVQGHASAGISPQVQDQVSSPYGGQGTQSGAWLKQFMNEP